MILPFLLSLIQLFICFALKKYDSTFIINKTKNKFIYKNYVQLNGRDRFKSNIKNDEMFNRPHAYIDPIPGNLDFLEKSEDADIRRRLWDEQVPIDDIPQRIDQLKNPEKYEKAFEEFMTTSLTVSKYPPKSPSSVAIVPALEKSTTKTNGYDNVTPEDSEEGSDEASFDDLISFNFFKRHPDYIPLLEQLMEKKLTETSGKFFKEKIKLSAFQKKIVSSEYFNKAAETALDLNCLVDSDITSIKWILDAISIVEETLETFKFKLGHIKWNSDMLCILIKDKRLNEDDVESIQTQIQQEINRLRYKYHITTIEKLSIFTETDAIEDFA